MHASVGTIALVSKEKYAIVPVEPDNLNLIGQHFFALVDRVTVVVRFHACAVGDETKQRWIP
jgi:hypothetical protein